MKLLAAFLAFAYLLALSFVLGRQYEKTRCPVLPPLKVEIRMDPIGPMMYGTFSQKDVPVEIFDNVFSSPLPDEVKNH